MGFWFEELGGWCCYLLRKGKFEDGEVDWEIYSYVLIILSLRWLEVWLGLEKIKFVKNISVYVIFRVVRLGVIDFRERMDGKEEYRLFRSLVEKKVVVKKNKNEKLIK